MNKIPKNEVPKGDREPREKLGDLRSRIEQKPEEKGQQLAEVVARTIDNTRELALQIRREHPEVEVPERYHV